MGTVKVVDVSLYKAVIDLTLDNAVLPEIVETTVAVMNRAKALCPVDTGNLRSSINLTLRLKSKTKITGEVYTKVKYALPVHEGRRPVVIRPNKKKALRFRWHGETFVRKWVWQPARHGRPFLTEALRQVAAQRGYEYKENM